MNSTAAGIGIWIRQKMLTKADALDAETRKTQIAKLKRASGQTPMLMSAHTHEGVDDVLRAVWRKIEEAREAEKAASEPEKAWSPV